MAAIPKDFRDENGRWKCTACGACCLSMCKMDPTMKKWDRGDGGCKHLTEEMTCAIYEDRPHNCRALEFRDKLSDLRLSRYCARYKNVMDEEIARGWREPDGKRLLKRRQQATEIPLPWPAMSNIR
jgi:uncharacterized cysteine cluster protein YcgN (CxxCxxCC family)